jgi:hypothetical protein
MSLEARIAEEVRALARLDLEGLRSEWGRRYGAPPKLRSVDMLARMLAWRIQAEALGGLDPDLARRLRRGTGLGQPRTDLPAGTRLSREWQGRVHEVEAVEGGFLYAGQTYRSLSKVAGVITGVKWNGRRFFGLDQEAAP